MWRSASQSVDACLRKCDHYASVLLRPAVRPSPLVRLRRSPRFPASPRPFLDAYTLEQPDVTTGGIGSKTDRTHERQGALRYWNALVGSHPLPLSRTRERGDQNRAPGRSNAAEVGFAHIFCPPLKQDRGVLPTPVCRAGVETQHGREGEGCAAVRSYSRLPVAIPIRTICTPRRRGSWLAGSSRAGMNTGLRTRSSRYPVGEGGM